MVCLRSCRRTVCPYGTGPQHRCVGVPALDADHADGSRISPDEATLFVDDAFRAYVDPLVRTRTEECPAVFFRRLLGKEVQDVPARQLAVISGVMAMILAAVLDKLEQYEFLTC